MSLPDNNLGSRIVTTSRVIAIAEKWHYDLDAFVWRIDYPLIDYYGVNKMISMRPDMVGEGFDHDRPLVDMCAGVPLAELCMISAVAKERERQERQGQCVARTRDLQDRVLEQVNRNGIQNTPGFEAWVESLELGYNDLPHHMLKTCLLYCGIYPKGHLFNRGESNDLVRRWIAEGFVCEEEAAEDYYDELVSRGFWKCIPDIFRVIFQGSWSSSYEGQMHPMMRNYLRRKLREENFITCTSDGVPSSPICRLCIDYWPSSDAVDPLSGIDWRHIRSLVVFKDAEKVPYKNLEHLRVLDVKYHRDGAFKNQHLKDICGLLRLRHLFMSVQITILPSEIGDLKQLKTVDVSYCYGLTELPREMENLQHLETVRLYNTDITEQAWEIIRTLKKLRTLDLCQSYGFSGILSNIGELQQLKNLYLRQTSITELPKDIGKLQQLKNLDVSWNRSITFLPKEIGKLQHLETLNVSVTGITELPKEIGNLGRLEALYLSDVRTITKLPREIGKLQHLERLHLIGTNVRKIPREIGGLKKLKILDAATGTQPFEAGQIPKLKGLPECVQRAWKNSDLVSSLSGEILSFHRVDDFGDGGLVMGTKHMHIPQWIKEHFNKIGFLDIRICKLEERDLKILREMPYLCNLKLRFECVPRKPIAISSEGFAQLIILYIDSRVPRITFQEGAMPSLLSLVFEFQFYGGPPNTDPPMGIKHLVNLEEVRFTCNEWYQADSPCIKATIDAVIKEAREHPNQDFGHVLLIDGQREEVVF